MGLLLTKSNSQRKHEMHSNNRQHDGYIGCDARKSMHFRIQEKVIISVQNCICDSGSCCYN
jgi:hypothetical protein